MNWKEDTIDEGYTRLILMIYVLPRSLCFGTRLDFVRTHDARADIHSWYTKIDCPGLQILVRDTAKPKHCPFADRDPRPNRAARGDPGPVVDVDRAGNEIERRSRPVMVTGAQIRPLRDAAIRTDRDIVEIVDPDILAEPRVIPNFESPGELHSYARFDLHALADLGTERTKEPSPVSRPWNPRCDERPLR